MDDTNRMMAIAGAISALIAVVAWLADRRRQRRSDLDSVGWMPWTTIFFWTLMAAVLLLGLSGRRWLGG